MKRGVVLFVLLALFCSSALALDVHPAPWRTDPLGQAPSTYQRWEFSTGANPVVADEFANPYSPPDPTAEVLGADPPPFPDTYWMDIDPASGRQGVWVIYGSDSMMLHIPNNPIENETKEIWLQITYSAGSIDRKPNIQTDPPYVPESWQNPYSEQLDPLYYHDVFYFVIEPNPPEEWIRIKPRDCTLYIDEIVVETICTPEPMTIMLLGLGSLGLLRAGNNSCF